MALLCDTHHRLGHSSVITHLSSTTDVCIIAAVKPGTHWRQSRPYRQQSRPSWRQCRPRQAVEFKLLPICRRFRQQSTSSPVCTGLHTDVHGSTMPNFNIHKLTGFVYNYKQKRDGGLAVDLDCSAAAVPKIKSKF